MAEGKRPGGLTALAVLNFVFGGLAILGVLAVYALLKAGGAEILSAANKLGASGPSPTMIYLSLALSVVGIICLFVSGVGYLGQKKFLGRTVGNIYSVVALGNTGFGLAVLHLGFGISSIIGLIYPVLTLALLNTVFKDDFVN